MATEVAVLMAAYNADATIRQAIESALAGTMPCRVFVVDDCSRVPASQVLGQMDRVEVIRLDKNLGPAGARNAGLERIIAAKYRYVAIFDADDISYPERFAKQVAFLEENPGVAAVGTWARYVDDRSGEPVFHLRNVCDPDAVRSGMFYNCVVANSSVMIRTDALVRLGFYSADYPAAEDYELLRRIATEFDLANLPEYLVDFRISRNGISVQRRKRQLFDRLRIQIKYFAPLNWRAWAGVAATLLLFPVPRTLVTAIKRRRG